jgi:hypothetical protein
MSQESERKEKGGLPNFRNLLFLIHRKTSQRMTRRLPLTLFVAATLFASLTSLAQDRFAYAITDLSKEGAGWNALRRLDLKTGQYSEVLLNGSDQQAVVFDAATRKQLTLPASNPLGTLFQAPFGTGVAAAAYDRRHHRIYYTPMFIDQLRYIDLKTMKVYFVADQPLAGTGDMHNDEARIITRMVIAPDGYGYAISNDGNHFIRFSTGKKTKIEKLGSLVDDPENKGVSIHNRCSSFGGDMIADDKGNLIILSARNQVFSVSTETKVAKHLGSIQQLPGNFTVNGAAVDAEGNLLVSSAVDGNTYYRVDPSGWTATPFTAAAGIYRSSDLANGNYLASRRAPSPFVTVSETVRSRPEDKFAKLISVYPNPVTSNNITLQFSKVPAGDYTIELTDGLGRSVMQRRITVNAEMQNQTLTLARNRASGTYLVRIIDRHNAAVYNQKVLVQ